MNFYPLTILEVKKLTSKSILIKFEIPEKFKNKFKRNAGQFVRLRVKMNEEIKEKEYSICSSPSENSLSIAIKETEKPNVSKYLNNNVKKGDILDISNPLGNFSIPIKPNEKRTIVAFCAGSGITPIMSIIKDTLEKEKNVLFFLFYGNRKQSEVMFYEELNSLKDCYKNNFYTYYFYSKEEMEDQLFEGRIDPDKLDLIINQIVDWDEVDEALVCGPSDMIINLANAIYEKGIPKENIHYELFFPIERNIYKDTVETKSLIDEVKVTVIYEDEKIEFIWKNDGTPLLEAMIENDIDAPYSCKGGVCASCMCKKEEGEVIIKENIVLTEHDLTDKKILPCVSFPMSENLVINLD